MSFVHHSGLMWLEPWELHDVHSTLNTEWIYEVRYGSCISPISPSQRQSLRTSSPHLWFIFLTCIDFIDNHLRCIKSLSLCFLFDRPYHSKGNISDISLSGINSWTMSERTGRNISAERPRVLSTGHAQILHEESPYSTYQVSCKGFFLLVILHEIRRIFYIFWYV